MIASAKYYINQEIYLTNCHVEFCLEDPGDGGGGVGSPSFPNIKNINIIHYNIPYEGEHCVQILGVAADCNYYFVSPYTGYVDIKAEIGYPVGSYRLTVYDNLINLLDINYDNNGSKYMYINNLEVRAGNYYLIKVAHNQGYVNLWNNNYISVTVTLKDDNLEDKPKYLTSSIQLSSKIDYPGDVDYYIFTNLGGYYDIYSTGYGNGNIDVKAELYLCNNTSCSSYQSTAVVKNDDYKSLIESEYIKKIEYSGMGSYDFGFRVNLGNDTINRNYLLKVYHWNNSQIGNYTLNFKHFYYLNDSFAKSTQLPNPNDYSSYLNEYGIINHEVNGYLYRKNDQVYYKFYINREYANVNITLSVPKNVDYDLYLYDSNYNLIKVSQLGTGKSESINLKNLKTGLYYVKIYSFSGYSTTEKYKLKIEGVEYNNIDLRYSNGNYINYGVKWTYSNFLSTTSNYTAYSRYQYDTTQYLYQQIFLYNFNKDNLRYFLGFIEGIINELEKDDTFFEKLASQPKAGIILEIAIGIFDVIKAYKSATFPYILIIELGVTGITMFIDVTDTQYNINMLKYYASIINEVLNSETKGIKVNIYKKLLVDDLIYEYTIWDYGTSTSINPTLPDSHYENYTVYGTSEFLYSQDNLSSTDSQLYYINIMSDLKLKHRKPQ